MFLQVSGFEVDLKAFLTVCVKCCSAILQLTELACPHTIVGCHFLFWYLLFLHKGNLNSNGSEVGKHLKNLVWFQNVELQLEIFLRCFVCSFVWGFADVTHICLTSCFCTETSDRDIPEENSAPVLLNTSKSDSRTARLSPWLCDKILTLKKIVFLYFTVTSNTTTQFLYLIKYLWLYLFYSSYPEV